MRWTERGLRFLPLLVCVALACAGAPQARGDEKSKPESDKPLATAEHETGLVVEVVEVKRDEHEMLLIRWRYRNPTDKPIELLAKSPVIGAGPKTAFLNNTYYIEGKLDSAEAFRVSIVRTADKKSYRAKELPKAAVVVGANKDWEFWAYFELPHKGNDTIALHVLGAPAIEGLAVPKAAPKK
jgi:hypothetical protein